MAKKFTLLLLSIGICLGVGLLGSIFTVPAISTWYSILVKPSFSPPNFLFGPVWTTLYILMGISLYLIWRKGKVPSVFWGQLILNGLWSFFFFGLRNPLLGLIDIVALWILIMLTIKSFYKINKWAGIILIPYFAWVTFATILNYSIWVLNR